VERTYVMVKPDGVQRSLVGEIISRFEKKGLKIVALKMLRIPREKAETHYVEHQGKSFFEPMIEYITSGPVVALVLEGNEAVSTVRDMMGVTNPLEAAQGTVRGDFGLDISRNVAHSSDSIESAAREIGLFFAAGEIVEYKREIDSWINE